RALDLAELAGDDDAGAPPGDRPPDQRLVVSPTIHVRAVEEGDAAIERLIDERRCRRVVAGAVDARERHAAEADRRDPDAARAQHALFHRSLRKCRLCRRQYWEFLATISDKRRPRTTAAGDNETEGEWTPDADDRRLGRHRPRAGRRLSEADHRP